MSRTASSNISSAGRSGWPVSWRSPVDG